MLKGEKLKRTVPVRSVPALSCASGAQCSPLRTQMSKKAAAPKAEEAPAAEAAAECVQRDTDGDHEE